MADADQAGARQAHPTDLAAVTERYNAEGLFRSYAMGRVRYVWFRQIMTVLGSVAIWIVDGPLYGLAAFSAAVFGEVVDCTYLRHAIRQLDRNVPLARVSALSTLTALFQAMSICFAIALAWVGALGLASPLFPAAFLTGAIVNAGMVMPYHRPSSIVRIGVYGLLGAMFLSTGASMDPNMRDAYAMNVAGVCILAWLCVSYLSFANRWFHLNRQNMLKLAEQSCQVAEANAELVQREEENQLLLEAIRNANDSIVVYGEDGRITWVNDAFTRITGYQADEAIGRTASALFNVPETDRDTIAAFTQAISESKPFRGEILNKTKSGERIWIETNQVPFQSRRKEDHPKMYIAVERDVTEAKQQARELALAKAAAEEGARAKSDFLATMSHEIRTPMNGVIGMAELLCEGELSDDQRLYAETIRSSSQALLDILNDVLDVSKLDAGRMQLSPIQFDIRGCVDGVVTLLTPQAQAKDLWLKTDIDDRVPQYVVGDVGRIRQILVNLIGNAVKFTESGGVTVIVSGHQAGDICTIKLSVKDTGIGIPPDKLATIFEKFSQADDETSRQFGGTGLGLTISRMLVNEMGGHVGVASHVGQGSCFTVSLPLGVAEQDAQVENGARDGATQLAGLDVLVAEDNGVNRLLIEKQLMSAQVRLRFAVDGAEAVDQCREDPPDVILMDMSMPKKNGLDATREIRALAGPQPVIVALTANAFARDLAACLEAGMDDFLTKPVRREDLIDCLLAHAPQVAEAAQA